MTRTLTCPSGHQWQAPAGETSVCPICSASPGTRVTSAVPAEASAAPTVDDSAVAATPRFSSRTPAQTVGEAVPVPQIPGYEILAELGRGGMGVVYQARQPALNRVVALKMILAGPYAGADVLARFRGEAEAIARLQHPNIVQLFEVGESRDPDGRGRPFFSLEFVGGGTLAARIAGAPQPPREAAALVETLARAMHYAHTQGVVHRDLKPSNVLLASEEWRAKGQEPEAKSGSPLSSLGSPLLPKITDFGLAKPLDADQSQTQTGAVLGTPSYMAPEQAWGKSRLRPAGPWTDVYALGAILYELLTGRPPFKGATPLDTLDQVVSQEPVAVRRLQPKVPRDLETIALRCLQKEPRKRYVTAEALADDLRCFLEGRPIHARPAGAVERSVKWARRRPALASLIVVSVLAAAGLAGLGLSYYADLQEHSRSLQTERDLARKAEAKAKTQRDLAQKAEAAVTTQRDLALKAEATAKTQRNLARKAEADAKDQRNKLAVALDRASRGRYALQLTLANAASVRDPAGALRLLEDPESCPAALRDFTWHLLKRRTHRLRLVLRGVPERWGAMNTTDQVYGVAYSPDGKLFASVNSGNKVAERFGEARLWDAATGRVLADLPQHSTYTRALAFAPDGKTLATAGAGPVRLWDVAQRRERATLGGPKDLTNCLVFSPDGKTLFTGHPDGTVKLWDTTTLQERKVLKAHSLEVAGLAVAPDGKTLATGPGGDWQKKDPGDVKLWDVESGQVRATLKAHRGKVTCLAFAPDGQTLVTGGMMDDRILLWEVAGGRQLAELRADEEFALAATHVLAAAFSPDGRTLAVAEQDWLLFFDVGSRRLLTALKGFEKGTVPVYGVAYSPDGREVTTGSGDGAIRVWRRPPRPEDDAIAADARRGVPLALCPDGKLLTLAGGAQPEKRDNPGVVRLWDRGTGKELATLASIRGLLGPQVAFTPDGKAVAWYSDPISPKHYTPVWCYDLEAGRLRFARDYLGGRVHFLAFSPDGKTLALGGYPQVRLVDAQTGAETRKLDEPGTGGVGSLVFTPDGKKLITADGNGFVKLRDLSDGTTTLLGRLQHGGLSLALAPDGATLAVGGADKTVRLWDPTTGRERAALRGHTFGVRAVAFSPDGKTLASASLEGTVMLWDPVTGHARATLKGPSQGQVTSLMFTADSKLLAVRSQEGWQTDGLLKLWDATPLAPKR